MDDVEAACRAHDPVLWDYYDEGEKRGDALAKEQRAATVKRMEAAIATLFERMMVPTPAMLAVAEAALDDFYDRTRDASVSDAAGHVFTAMLRARATEMDIEVKG